MAHTGQIQAVIVFSVSRWIRNRDQLLDDLQFLSHNGVKFHSVKDPYIEAVNMEGPMGRTIRDFLIGLAGSMAELESLEKSARMKASMEEGEDGKKVYKRTGSKVGQHSFDVKYPGARTKIMMATKAGRSQREIARVLKIPRSSVQRVIVEERGD